MKTDLFLCCCLFCAGVTIFDSCGGKNGQGPQGQAQSYQTVTIEKSDKTVIEQYSATIKGKQDIDIYPQISGTIGQVCVIEGQRVKNGQKLFVIEQGTYLAALNEATANVKSAEASLASSKLSCESKESLFKDSVISDYELQTAKNSYTSAQASLAQAQAKEASARTNYNYTIITSPADGVVGDLPYFQGDLVSSSISQPLTTVSDNSQMYVYFSITEKQLLFLTRKFGSVEETLKTLPDVSLKLSDGTQYANTGRIESISGVVDKSTGSTTLRARFPNPDGLLHSGFSGVVLLPTDYTDCFVIPQAATTEIQNKVFVYKVVDGKAQSAEVQVTVADNGNEYIVTSGVQEGDVIIANGAGLVREGAAVKIDNGVNQGDENKKGEEEKK